MNLKNVDGRNSGASTPLTRLNPFILHSVPPLSSPAAPLPMQPTQPDVPDTPEEGDAPTGHTEEINVVQPVWGNPPRTNSSRSVSTTSTKPKTPPTERFVRGGLIFMVTMEGLISLSSIILTMWYPGLCLAATICMMFIGVLLLFMAYGNVRFLDVLQPGSYCGRVTFLFSLAAALCTLLLALYSILIEVKIMADDARMGCVIAACGAFALHYALSVRTTVRISKDLSGNRRVHDEGLKPTEHPMGSLTELS